MESERKQLSIIYKRFEDQWEVKLLRGFIFFPKTKREVNVNRDKCLLF